MKVTYELNMPKNCWECRLAGRICMLSMCVCRTEKDEEKHPEYCLLHATSNGKAEIELEEEQIKAGNLYEHLEKMGAVKK